MNPNTINAAALAGRILLAAIFVIAGFNKIAGFDPGADKAFERGAYRRDVPLLDVKKLRGYQASSDIRPAEVGASLSPPHGAESPSIVPSDGTERPPAVPSDGAMQGVFCTPPVPPGGHPLEEPSAGVGLAVAGGAAVGSPAHRSKPSAGRTWRVPPPRAEAASSDVGTRPELAKA